MNNAIAVREAFTPLRAEIVPLFAQRPAAWQTMRQDPASFWSATWAE